MTSLPIGEPALLSDRHSAALVTAAGSVDWMCMPRFDSPAMFGRILDDQDGHWSIRPDADFQAERQYVAASMVLLTTFHTTTGTLELRDALVLGGTKAPYALGEHQITNMAELVGYGTFLVEHLSSGSSWVSIPSWAPSARTEPIPPTPEDEQCPRRTRPDTASRSCGGLAACSVDPCVAG